MLKELKEFINKTEKLHYLNKNTSIDDVINYIINI